jgi:hypothetical protein
VAAILAVGLFCASPYLLHQHADHADNVDHRDAQCTVCTLSLSGLDAPCCADHIDGGLSSVGTIVNTDAPLFSAAFINSTSVRAPPAA